MELRLPARSSADAQRNREIVDEFIHQQLEKIAKGLVDESKAPFILEAIDMLAVRHGVVMRKWN